MLRWFGRRPPTFAQARRQALEELDTGPDQLWNIPTPRHKIFTFVGRSQLNMEDAVDEAYELFRSWRKTEEGLGLVLQVDTAVAITPGEASNLMGYHFVLTVLLDPFVKELG